MRLTNPAIRGFYLAVAMVADERFAFPMDFPTNHEPLSVLSDVFLRRLRLWTVGALVARAERRAILCDVVDWISTGPSEGWKAPIFVASH
jgi:hypothetical protein